MTGKEDEMSNEKKESRGSRGFGTLMFAAVPGALAGAAILWLTAVTGVIDLTSELRQERRAAERVGIVVLPKTPINVAVREDSCLKSAGVYLDGDQLTVYAKNKCSHPLEFHSSSAFRLIAPDGTVIRTGGTYFDGDVFYAGEKREATLTIPEDERTVKVLVSFKDDGN